MHQQDKKTKNNKKKGSSKKKGDQTKLTEYASMESSHVQNGESCQTRGASEQDSASEAEPEPDTIQEENITIAMVYRQICDLNRRFSAIEKQTLSDVKELKEKVSKIASVQADVEKSCEHATETAEETKAVVDQLQQEVNKLTTELKRAKEETIKLQRYSHGFNLRFYGIQENPGEVALDVIGELLTQKFNIDP